MNTTIRNIGNSKGIILSKNILAQCKIKSDISVEVQDRHIIITAVKSTPKRKGWGRAFKEMAENGDNALVMPDVFKDEHTEGW